LKKARTIGYQTTGKKRTQAQAATGIVAATLSRCHYRFLRRTKAISESPSPHSK
jgi:hypothetical protein